MTEPGNELQNYVDKAMFDAQPLDEGALERPRVRIIGATPDPLGVIAFTMMGYEGRFPASLGEITDAERREYFAESFKSHLKAPWEFIQFHIVVEGITRGNSHQMVRQRTATFVQESTRFAVKPELRKSVRPGPSIKGSQRREAVYDRAIVAINEAYHALIADGVPAEDARGLLPHDTLTRLNWRTNLADLDHHMGNRLCTQAQFEWRLIAADLKRALEQYAHPARPEEAHGLDGYAARWQWMEIASSGIFRPVCYKLGHCPWTSKIDRGCTIRERVDQGRFDLVETAEWLADPTAGWVR